MKVEVALKKLLRKVSDCYSVESVKEHKYEVTNKGNGKSGVFIVGSEPYEVKQIVKSLA